MDVRKLDYGALIFGVTVLLVGGFYLLRNTFGFALGDLYWDGIWPVFVIALGASVLFKVVGSSTRKG